MQPPIKTLVLLFAAAAAACALACTKKPTGPVCTGRWTPKSAERYTCVGAPRNTILLIGDGMGPEQVRAGRLLTGGPLAMESLPHHGSATTCSTTDPVTDSAAAATAMATGLKVSNGVLALELPGSGKPIPTITEQAVAAGKNVGLVTTTYITHATPAAFALHLENRYMDDALVDALLRGVRPSVLLGGAKYAGAERARAAGYEVVETREQLLAVDPAEAEKLWGMFGDDNLPYEKDGLGDLPHLSEMTRVALAILERDPDGFFLMIEGGRIDHAGHNNDLERLGPEVAEFDKAVQAVMEWARGRSDTLVLVTADHETGGLELREHAGGPWPPPASWKHDEHTNTPVPIYAWGVNAGLVRQGLDNTDIFRIMGGCPIPRP